ncbi:MAG TPA: hypothetical protein VM101_06275 [Flavitalea sp.]|nr:hypothetical protein [Flavitalea sp.]
MKNSILSLAIVMMAILGYNSVKAQNAHYNSGPCVSSDGRTITAVITGLGQGGITVVCSGQMDCINPGDNRPPAWSDFDLSRSFDKKNGGNFNLNFTLSSLCNKRWTFETQNLSISVYQNGNLVLGPTPVTSCQ